MTEPGERVHYGIDTVRPLSPAQNYFQLIGWAFAAGSAEAGEVRVVVGDRTFAPTERIERADVAGQFPDEPAALLSGFKFIGYLPFGFYTGELQVWVEAERSERSEAPSTTTSPQAGSGQAGSAKCEAGGEDAGNRSFTTEAQRHGGTAGNSGRSAVDGGSEARSAEQGAGGKEQESAAARASSLPTAQAACAEHETRNSGTAARELGGPGGPALPSDGGWERVCTFAIPVSSHPILGAIDFPPPDEVITEPVRIQGWCFHPEFRVTQVVLQFGNVEVPCEYGRERHDVAARFPEHPQAAASGFITTENLPRGHGGMKIRVRTECGRVYFVSSAHRVQIERGWIPKPPPPSPVRDLSTAAWKARRAKSKEQSAGELGTEQDAVRERGALREQGAGSKEQDATQGRANASSQVGTRNVEREPAGGANVAGIRTAEAGRQAIGADQQLGTRNSEPGTPRAARERGERNILLALYGDFSANSALHVASFANELIALGYDCVVAVPDHKETLGALPQARFMAVQFDELESLPAYYRDGRGPVLVHAWTSRENVRKFTDQVVARYGSAVFVHLEDNEQDILETRLGRPFGELARLTTAELDALVPGELSHPHRAATFLKAAAGVTVIVDRLREHVPSGVPTAVIWPGADARHFTARPRDDGQRRALGLAPDDAVLFYHGNTHTSNAAEVRSLYEAVALLNQRGLRTILIRTGRDFPGFREDTDPWVRPYLVHLGFVGRAKHLPALMALADYFVQPGSPDAFNDYRFPSKLPEFFSIGRPVLLPRTNLGAVVRHGEDAWVLDRADAAAIADAIVTLHGDPALRARLSAGALAFAASHFSWRKSTQQLVAFYRSAEAVDGGR